MIKSLLTAVPWVVLSLAMTLPANAADKKIVLIAGPITGHGKHTHEYEKNVILLKHLLDTSPNTKGVTVEAHFNGWPKNPKTLDTASTIVMISDGGDHKETNHPLYIGDRLKQIERQMKRGCGFVHFHWTTFHPSRFHKRVTKFAGGYFDYEKGGGTKKWYSAIKTWTGPTKLGATKHPISRGVKPFRIQEEFYYRIRFDKNDKRLRPILMTRPPGESKDYVVGWSVQRDNGGRSFGFTGGHFYRNWWNADYRRLILNAIVWTTGLDVPQGGVQSKLEEPIQALILTGHNHPAHDWRAVTASLIGVLEQDPRMFVDVTENIEDLGAQKIHRYDLLVMNYSNWDRPGLSKAAKDNFVRYLKAGGGLSVIHFANGSFTDTLPNKKSDWKEYRTRIVRRIWFHGKGRSGHDSFGAFQVEITKKKHPITAGLKSFRTIDELYFRQEGKLPITPLATARSKVTKKDEPMAFAYPYGKGRIFQTVLGHGPISVRMGGALIRRGSTWAAGHKPISFDPPVEQTKNLMFRGGSQWNPLESQKRGRAKKKQALGKPLEKGKFGLALNGRATSAFTAEQAAYRKAPFTVECWAKLNSAKSFNILVANERKNSSTHWEIYSYSRTGAFSFYMPRSIPAEIKSNVNICDKQWHYLVVQRTAERVRMFVDGKLVKEQAIRFTGTVPTTSGLSFASLVERTIGCDGWIDEVRISKGIRKVTTVPTKPFANDDSTVGLWHFDNPKKSGLILDQSKLHNSAQLLSVTKKPTGKTTGHWGEEAVGFRWIEDDSKDSRWNQTTVGPFLAATFDTAGGRVNKGLAIRLGTNQQATIAYDGKTMTARAGWVGGFLRFNEARYGIIVHPRPVGTMKFGLKRPAWGNSKVRYLGMYQNGSRVALEYEVDGTRIREVPHWQPRGGSTFIRTLEIEPTEKPLLLNVMQVGRSSIQHDNRLELDGERAGNQFKTVAVLGGKARIERVAGTIRVRIPPHKQVTQIRVFVGMTPQTEWAGYQRRIAAEKISRLELRRSLKPGPKNWPTVLQTSGFRRKTTGPFVVETIGLPFRNPYRALFFLSGHDFLSDGRAAVCTIHGDVWLVSGLDQALDNVVWRRFATGLFQPLGLKVVRDQIYVLGRDQITRLHDRDKNGEADFYECFCNLTTTSAGGHDYVTCLETDTKGNFYFVSAVEGLVRVSPDGRRKEIVAAGFRNPNGLGMGPNDEITVAPQEGEWTPASNIALVRPGGWYGFRGPKITPKRPLGYDPPLLWMPRRFDNSSAGQVWVTNPKWKSLFGKMLHLSFGTCRVQLVLQHRNGKDARAAAAVSFPFDLDSGVMRGRFGPQDGHLYLTGMKGWVSSAVRDGCFHRIRYTGKPIDQPVEFRVAKNGVLIRFDQPLDREFATRPGNYLVEQWNYHWSAAYGSPELRVSNPKSIGRDEVEVRSASLLRDGKTVFLELPNVRPVMQMRIHYNVRTATGRAVRDDLFATIHSVPCQSIKPTSQRRLTQLPKATLAALRPGLICRIGDDYSGKTDARHSRMLALSNPAKTPISPFIANSTAKLSYVGYLRVRQPDEYRFHLESEQPAVLTIGKQLNLRVKRGKATSKKIFLPRGHYPIRYQVDAGKDGAVHFRVAWSSNSFIQESLPPQALWHDSRSTNLMAAQRMRRGRDLYAQLNCSRCHTTVPKSTAFAMPELAAEPPSLQDLGKRVTRRWLYEWLQEPRSHRSSPRMPQMFSNPLTPAQRSDLVHLVSYIAPRPKTTDELQKQDDKSQKLGARLFEELGCIACHRFNVKDDAWRRLSLDQVHKKYHHGALANFLQKPGRHHVGTRMPNFSLSKVEAKALEAHLRSVPRNLATVLIAGNPRTGKHLFARHRCNQCHRIGRSELGKPFRKFPKAQLAGCLSSKTTRQRAPHYRLAGDDQQAMLSFLRSQNVDALYRDTPAEAAHRLTRALRCNACHRRDGNNSHLPAILAEESLSGKILERPPSLTWTGEKLRNKWLGEFLSGRIAARPRPWLKTRMPTVSSIYAKSLTQGLASEHGVSSKSAEPSFPARTVAAHLRYGRQLVQKNGGLDCQQCHAMGQRVLDLKNKSNGVNLDKIYQRIRYPFYRRWLHNPQRVDPQTKMPRFAIDGRHTKITNIYGGDANRQFDALWIYLNSLKK